jgi:hypothetical protein
LLLLSYEARFVRWYYSRWYWKVLDVFDLQNNGGILREEVECLIGHGVVLSMSALIKELRELDAAGVSDGIRKP